MDFTGGKTGSILRRRLKNDPMALEQRVQEIIAEQLGIAEEEIQQEASFSQDLGADSLDFLELIMALEEEFEIEIPDSDAEKLATVQKLVQYLESKTQ